MITLPNSVLIVVDGEQDAQGRPYEIYPTVTTAPMLLVKYASPDPVDGLMLDRHDSPKTDKPAAQTYIFYGYLCDRCRKSFLVPDSVTNPSSLYAALRHTCTTKEGATMNRDG